MLCILWSMSANPLLNKIIRKEKKKKTKEWAIKIYHMPARTLFGNPDLAKKGLACAPINYYF